MLLDKEKISSNANLYYRKITLLESKVLEYVLFATILMNVIFCYGIISKVGMNSKVNLAVKMTGLGCEIVIIYITICLFRINEHRFNRLLKNGIVLKTEINKNKSCVSSSGKSIQAIIHSRYICEDGTPLLFNQVREVNIGREVLFSRQLQKENYINVLVNPEKFHEYYMMIHEIGIKPEKKI